MEDVAGAARKRGLPLRRLGRVGDREGFVAGAAPSENIEEDDEDDDDGLVEKMKGDNPDVVGDWGTEGDEGLGGAENTGAESAVELPLSSAMSVGGKMLKANAGRESAELLLWTKGPRTNAGAFASPSVSCIVLEGTVGSPCSTGTGSAAVSASFTVQWCQHQISMQGNTVEHFSTCAFPRVCDLQHRCHSPHR